LVLVRLPTTTVVIVVVLTSKMRAISPRTEPRREIWREGRALGLWRKADCRSFLLLRLRDVNVCYDEESRIQRIRIEKGRCGAVGAAVAWRLLVEE
jgi:hypothetical protein